MIGFEQLHEQMKEERENARDAMRRALEVYDRPTYGDDWTKLEHASEAMDILRAFLEEEAT